MAGNTNTNCDECYTPPLSLLSGASEMVGQDSTAREECYNCGSGQCERSFGTFLASLETIMETIPGSMAQPRCHPSTTAVGISC